MAGTSLGYTDVAVPDSADAVPPGMAHTASLGSLYPTLDVVEQLAADPAYTRVPLMREILADTLTPIEAMRRLRSASNHCFLLESAEQDERCGRYSFLGFDPILEVSCSQGTLHIRRVTAQGKYELETTQVDHPADTLRAILRDYRAPHIEGMPPFCGGLVGYFSYDYLKYAEPSLRSHELAHSDFLDVDLMLFNKVVVFDSYTQRVGLITLVDVGNSAQVAASYDEAAATLDSMQQVLMQGDPYTFEPLHIEQDFSPHFSEDAWEVMVHAAQQHILDGDVFQIVLSNPLVAKAAGSLFDTYRLMRASNPSPYMVFMSSNDIEIAAASPETLVRLQNNTLLTYPLAGSRPRGATHDEDRQLEAELLADEKELAEHNMLVDLGRNDLGRVCELGSVEVENYLEVLKFSHIMHLGSTVKGSLDARCDALDVIDSILPAGTLSGAPKIRACQLIQELEGSQRGIYGGAIGYIDLTGNLDTCIAIRMAYKRGDRVCVQSGAGIVADSDPGREYIECRNKARAALAAVRASEGGLPC